MQKEICIECGRKWIGHKVPDIVSGCLVCPWCMEKELPMSHKMSGEPQEGGKCWETNSDFERRNK